MYIKRLEGKERFDAYMTAVYCFHMRMDDPEAEREKCESDTKEDWGAFDEDGKLMARILNHKYELYLDGKTVRCGGIGGVATFPEYRGKGAIREIFAKLLPAAYADGEVLSGLYPFKHDFYRKQGYETVTKNNEYSLRPELLCRYAFDGTVKKWECGEPVRDFYNVYREFAPQFNLAKERSEEEMLKLVNVEKPYQERKFSYVLYMAEAPVAYVVFTDIRHDPAAILKVEECAWTGRDGFLGILGFLARFEADYGTIILPLPAGIDLLRIIESPLAYEIEKTPSQSFMVRVINAVKLAKVIRKPADCDFTMRVSDEIIAENNVTIRVRADEVQTVSEELPDMVLNIRTLGQLALGCLNIDEAKLRKDVEISGNEEMLRRVFGEKKIFVSEHF